MLFDIFRVSSWAVVTWQPSLVIVVMSLSLIVMWLASKFFLSANWVVVVEAAADAGAVVEAGLAEY